MSMGKVSKKILIFSTSTIIFSTSTIFLFPILQEFLEHSLPSRTRHRCNVDQDLLNLNPLIVRSCRECDRVCSLEIDIQAPSDGSGSG